MNIGFVLNEHHTELLEFLFEIFVSLGHNLFCYIQCDFYNNLASLKSKFNFIVRSLDDLSSDYINKTCHKFIILSNTKMFFNGFIPMKHHNVIYLAHNVSELSIIQSSPSTFFAVSKSVCADNQKRIVPIIRNPSTTIQLINSFQCPKNIIHVLKIGWVTNTCDLNGYKRLLDTGKIHLHVFTLNNTFLLSTLVNKYPINITTHFQKSTDYILEYINKLNIDFVYYDPVNVDLWSGSIAFALNNNLTLLTNNQVIDLYNIPNGYYVSLDSDNFTDIMSNSTFNCNPNDLEKYRHTIFKHNSKILRNIVQDFLSISSLNSTIQVTNNVSGSCNLSF